MRRINQAAGIILAGLMLLPACRANPVQGQQELSPAATAIPAADSLPTVDVVVSTQTSTAEPLPTSTPQPALPAELEALTYRNLGQVGELASLPYPDVTGMEFSPDHRTLRLRQALGEDSFTDIFLDLDTQQEVFRLEGDSRIYFSPDSAWIAALGGTRMTVYDFRTGKEIRQYNSPNQVAALSPDGRLLVEFENAGEDGTTLRIVDLTKDAALHRIYVTAPVDKEFIQFDQDSRYMVLSYLVPPSAYVVSVWSMESGYPVFTTYGYGEIALHPFGSEIALAHASRDTISLVSTVSWEQRLYLGTDLPGPGFHNLAYSSGGRLIAALYEGERTEPFIWYPPSGERLDFDPGLDLTALAISPDRQLLALADETGQVTIWGLPR